jgi:hypothetical protein
VPVPANVPEQLGSVARCDALAIVAPPGTLANCVTQPLPGRRAVTEIGKNLAKHPISEIDRRLMG